MILQLFTNLCSIMAAALDSLNIAFYCGYIFAQSLFSSELKRNCVLILVLLTHEGYDFLDWHSNNYGTNLVQCCLTSKRIANWSNIVPTDCASKIGPIRSHSQVIWKRYHDLVGKERVLHFNLYLNKFIGLKFVAYYIKITQIDTLYSKFSKNETAKITICATHVPRTACSHVVRARMH